jgi:hypothetical protein
MIFAKIVEPVEGHFCTSIGLVNPIEGCHFMMSSNPISMVELSGFVFFCKGVLMCHIHMEIVEREGRGGGGSSSEKC